MNLNEFSSGIKKKHKIEMSYRDLNKKNINKL